MKDRLHFPECRDGAVESARFGGPSAAAESCRHQVIHGDWFDLCLPSKSPALRLASGFDPGFQPVCLPDCLQPPPATCDDPLLPQSLSMEMGGGGLNWGLVLRGQFLYVTEKAISYGPSQV